MVPGKKDQTPGQKAVFAMYRQDAVENHKHSQQTSNS